MSSDELASSLYQMRMTQELHRDTVCKGPHPLRKLHNLMARVSNQAPKASDKTSSLSSSVHELPSRLTIPSPLTQYGATYSLPRPPFLHHKTNALSQQANIDLWSDSECNSKSGATSNFGEPDTIVLHFSLSPGV